VPHKTRIGLGELCCKKGQATKDKSQMYSFNEINKTIYIKDSEKKRCYTSGVSVLQSQSENRKERFRIFMNNQIRRFRRGFIMHLMLLFPAAGLLLLAQPARAQCAVSFSISQNGSSVSVTGSFHSDYQGAATNTSNNAVVYLDGGPGGTVFYFYDAPLTLSTTLQSVSSGSHTLDWSCSTTIGSIETGGHVTTYHNSGSTPFTVQ
jgi:hypothetical protein